MPDQFEAVIYYASTGMNAAVHPSLLGKSDVSRMTNCKLQDQLPTTRPGIRFFPLDGDTENFSRDPIQGATYFNPSLGQTQKTFGPDQDSIIVAAGGRKYQVFIRDGAQRVEVSDITSGLLTDPDAYLVHLFQAEHYLIGQDGISDCFIWPGEGLAFFSKGYNIKNKDASQLANGGSVGVYAHGRIIQVVNGNQILVGDIVFKSDQTTPADILKTTEQLYWATGANFGTPANMGEVRGINFLPLRNTLYGHADVLLHCRTGVMSLDVSQYPRTNWANLQLTSIALLDTGASGPYSIALYNGDQIFRSRAGIQSLRSAAATADLFGNPQSPVSEPVQTWFDADFEQYLRDVCCAKWQTQNRLLVTTGQWRETRWRGAEGILSLNFMPLGIVQPQQWAWEGLWTLPPGHESVAQIVNATVNEADRTFFIGTSRQDFYNEETGAVNFRNFVAEVDPTLTTDVLPDGTEVPISSQVQSREFSGEDRTMMKELTSGTISLRGVQGDLVWGVWVRAESQGDWIYWRGDRSRQCDAQTVPADRCATSPDCPDCLLNAQPRQVVFGLGDGPAACKGARAWQFLVRWAGYAQLEYLRLGYQNADVNPGGMTLPAGQCSGKTSLCGNYSDVEYSHPDDWQKLIP